MTNEATVRELRIAAEMAAARHGVSRSIRSHILHPPKFFASLSPYCGFSRRWGYPFPAFPSWRSYSGTGSMAIITTADCAGTARNP